MSKKLKAKRVKVKREVIVKAARAAIQEAREEWHVDISTSEVRRLMKVARTAPKFVVGEWKVGDCGCLVGNLPDFPGSEELPEHLHAVGCEFDWQLRQDLLSMRGNFFKPTEKMRAKGETYSHAIVTAVDD